MSRHPSTTRNVAVSRRQLLRVGGLAALSTALGALVACQQPATPTAAPAKPAPAAPPPTAAAAPTAAPTAAPAAAPAATAAPAPAAPTKPAAAAPTSAPAAAKPAAPAAPVTLVHASWADPEVAWGKYQAKYMDQFKQSNPNVKIEYQSTPFGEYHTKLLTQAAAGTLPDTFAHSNSLFPKFAAKGGALALDELVAGEPAFDVKDFVPAALRLSSLKGKLYGVPHLGNVIARFWHKEMFKEAGLASPNDLDKQGKWDWNTFLDGAMKITKRDAAGKATRLGTSAPNINFERTQQWAWANGAEMLKQPDLNEFVLNSPEGIDAVQFMVDLINKHKVAPQQGEILQNQLSDFNSGRLAYFEDWAYFGDLGFKEHDYIDIVHPPKNKARVSILHPNSLAIAAKSKIPDVSFKWISTLASKQGDLDQPKLGIGIALRKSNLGALDEINRTEWKVGHPEVVSDIVNTGRIFDITPVHSEIGAIFNPAMDDVKLGRKSVKEVLDTIKPQIDKVLAAGVS
jgi:multiple sugar transport system substrate-binding protein